jgi:hypothetical protein
MKIPERGSFKNRITPGVLAFLAFFGATIVLFGIGEGFSRDRIKQNYYIYK